jgi:hypothetical protein
MLRAIEARNSLSLDAVLKQLNQLRNQGDAGGQAISVAPVKTPITPAERPMRKFDFSKPSPAAPAPPAPKSFAPVAPPAPAAPTGNLPELWSRLVDAVGRVSPFTRGYLIDAHPVSFEKNVLVIGYDPEFADHLGLVDNSRNHTLLATKLAEIGHHGAMIKFVKAEAPAGWERSAPAPASATAPTATKAASGTAAPKPVDSAAAPAAEKKPASVAFNKEDFKNDPLIKKALEIFKGTIVEVRA